MTFKTVENSAEILRLLRAGVSQKQIAAQFGVSPQRISQVKHYALERENHPKISMDLSARTRNALLNWGVALEPDAVAAYFTARPGDLKRVPSMGAKSITELNAWLVKHGQKPVR